MKLSAKFSYYLDATAISHSKQSSQCQLSDLLGGSSE